MYEIGKTYEYVYESDLKTSIPGATEEHSSLHMRSTVQVEVMSQCEMVLKVRPVFISKVEQKSKRLKGKAL